MHAQQVGMHPALKGHIVQFVKGDTLQPCYEAAVKSIQNINRDYTLLTFDKPLPETVTPGDAALDLYWQPSETLIRGFILGRNRARGFLISCLGHVLIEDCTFHTPGSAILITGDANYWFESGPVADVTIRNNRFLDCNYGVWGSATIEINPEIKPVFRHEPRYHRNIRIENNRFEVFFPRLLRAHSVDGLIWRGNVVVPSARYTTKEPEAEKFDVRDCSHVSLEGTIAQQ